MTFDPNDPQTRAALKRAWEEGLASADYDFTDGQIIAVDDCPYEAPAEHSYTVGIPLTVTFKVNGQIVLDFDLSEVDLAENVVPEQGYTDDEIEADQANVTDALASMGYSLTQNIINPNA